MTTGTITGRRRAAQRIARPRRRGSIQDMKEIGESGAVLREGPSTARTDVLRAGSIVAGRIRGCRSRQRRAGWKSTGSGSDRRGWPAYVGRGQGGLATTMRNELALDPHGSLTVVFRSNRG